MKSYSQHGEQTIILDFFDKNPPRHKLLVDVGAYGIEMSNSIALLQMGWKGIMIEANPNQFEIMRKEFDGKNVELLNIAIGDEEKEMDFYIHSNPGLSSLVGSWMPEDPIDKWIRMKARPLSDVLNEQNVPEDFDFLNMDAEGMDEDIMIKFFESQFRPRLIVTEGVSYKDANSLFNIYGYSPLIEGVYGGNLFYETKGDDDGREKENI